MIILKKENLIREEIIIQEADRENKEMMVNTVNLFKRTNLTIENQIKYYINKIITKIFLKFDSGSN